MLKTWVPQVWFAAADGTWDSTKFQERIPGVKDLEAEFERALHNARRNRPD